MPRRNKSQAAKSSSTTTEKKKWTSLDGTRESKYTQFRFPNDKDAIPEDFITDQETGLRRDQKTKPSGVSKTFINRGFTDWTPLPPLEVWDRGVWFVLLKEEQQEAIKGVVGDDSWEAWVVNGEGSPGNFLMRVYICPDEIASMMRPTHPLSWPEKHKRSSSYHSIGYSSGYGSGYNSPSGWQYQSSRQTTTTPKTQAPALPSGIRFRCADCGHWFKQDGLAAHNTNCCPGKEESRETDWALLCECCMTLDEVAACKPGFPRPKAPKEVEPKEQTEAKKDSATAEVVQ